MFRILLAVVLCMLIGDFASANNVVNEATDSNQVKATTTKKSVAVKTSDVTEAGPSAAQKSGKWKEVDKEIQKLDSEEKKVAQDKREQFKLERDAVKRRRQALKEKISEAESGEVKKQLRAELKDINQRWKHRKHNYWFKAREEFLKKKLKENEGKQGW